VSVRWEQPRGADAGRRRARAHALRATRLLETPDDADRADLLGPSARKQGLAVRAFFAVALKDALRAEVARLACELAARPDGDGVRWVAAESYHLTLRFLGNVAASEVSALAARAQDSLAGSSAFALRLGAPIALPTARRPRVIALAAQPEDALSDLAARLERAAVAHGVAPEPRPFRAHLTIGRVRAHRIPALAAAAPTAAQPVSEVVLFRSDLGPDGSRYSALATLPLGA
jgi:2'-5' RNA ligase